MGINYFTIRESIKNVWGTLLTPIARLKSPLGSIKTR
jgi:hypothetical protein